MAKHPRVARERGAESPTASSRAPTGDASDEDLTPVERKWRTMLQACSDMITLLDAEGRIIESLGAGPVWPSLDSCTVFPTSRPPGGPAGPEDWQALHPDESNRARRAFNFVLDNPGQPHRGVFRTHQGDGQWEIIEYTAVNHLDDPLIEAVVVTTRNVTEVKLAEALLADEARTLELIARGAPRAEALAAVTALVDEHTGGSSAIVLLGDGRRPVVAAAGTLPPPLATLSAARLANTPRAVLVPGRARVVADLAAAPEVADVAHRFIGAGFLAGWAMPIVDPAESRTVGAIVGLVPSARGLTEREAEVLDVAAHLASIAIGRDEAQRALEHRARHDPLTELPNRSAILEHLDDCLVPAAGPARAVGVLLIDIDRFRVVNDSLGHGAGDRLLWLFARRLRALLPPSAFVGHFGADEFAVVVDAPAGLDDVVRTANQIGMALDVPFSVDEGPGTHEIYLSAGIGAATAEADATSHGLVQQADAAMYRAKDRGRGRLEVFSQDMQSRATEQLRVDRELRLAVEQAQLRLHYQPKVDLGSGAIIGAEALLRWDHPERGVVGPAEFIAVAEQTGLIVRIGRWVLEEAVRQARRWVDTTPGLDRFAVAVNLSARQLTSPGLVPTVARVIQRHQWDPADLTLELTESILIDDAEATLTVLRQLKGLGVQLAIDDFGTGFSSLSYLHRFPVDIVKVDRAFVSPLDADGEGSAVATAVVHMARALGLIAVAEGVEHERQLAGLRTLGCDWAQGFLFAEARPADQLAELLAAGRRW